MKNEKQEQMKIKSIQGKPIRNDRETIRIERKKFKNLLAATFVAGSILTGIAVEGMDHLLTSFDENSLINTKNQEFRIDTIQPNTKRTDNHEKYFYEHSNIAEEIKNGDQISTEKLFYTYSNLGEDETNKVIGHLNTSYTSVDEFLEQSNYKNIKDWKNHEKERVNLEQELSRMQQESKNQELNATQTSSLGGK